MRWRNAHILLLPLLGRLTMCALALMRCVVGFNSSSVSRMRASGEEGEVGRSWAMAVRCARGGWHLLTVVCYSVSCLGLAKGINS
jgi:hypothetical protein